jgi:hypothetical protein
MEIGAGGLKLRRGWRIVKTAVSRAGAPFLGRAASSTASSYRPGSRSWKMASLARNEFVTSDGPPAAPDRGIRVARNGLPPEVTRAGTSAPRSNAAPSFGITTLMDCLLLPQPPVAAAARRARENDPRTVRPARFKAMVRPLIECHDFGPQRPNASSAFSLTLFNNKDVRSGPAGFRPGGVFIGPRAAAAGEDFSSPPAA